VFITYQRKAHSAGYFSADRFSGRIGKFAKHELALNPDPFIGQSDLQICQTLNHEMVHIAAPVGTHAPLAIDRDTPAKPKAGKVLLRRLLLVFEERFNMAQFSHSFRIATLRSS
jgi:hypothetical protein